VAKEKELGCGLPIVASRELLPSGRELPYLLHHPLELEGRGIVSFRVFPQFERVGACFIARSLHLKLLGCLKSLAITFTGYKGFQVGEP
jgi:hypothetical protein